MGAGVQWFEAYAFAEKNGITLVGGKNSSSSPLREVGFCFTLMIHGMGQEDGGMCMFFVIHFATCDVVFRRFSPKMLGSEN